MNPIKQLELIHLYQLSVNQARTLLHLYTAGPCRTTKLAPYLGISTAAVTTITDKLVAMKLISRFPFTNDRRIVMLHITNKGRAHAHSIITATPVNQKETKHYERTTK